MFEVTKTYDHNQGLSACFRQPKAKSHCKDPHGYPLAFKLVFEAHTLDENNWVIDFGSLKQVKQMLTETFDHRTILAQNDPFLAAFQDLYFDCGFADIVTMPFVGCEGFAKYVFDWIEQWLNDTMKQDIHDRGLRLVSVECREHSANSAIYKG